jgi:hypothetical protein
MCKFLKQYTFINVYNNELAGISMAFRISVQRLFIENETLIMFLKFYNYENRIQQSLHTFYFYNPS